jgi:ComEC/Rec2-related protein
MVTWCYPPKAWVTWSARLTAWAAYLQQLGQAWQQRRRSPLPRLVAQPYHHGLMQALVVWLAALLLALSWPHQVVHQVPWCWLILGSQLLLWVWVIRQGALMGLARWRPVLRASVLVMVAACGLLWGLLQHQRLPALPAGQQAERTLLGEVQPFHKGWVLETEQGWRVLIRQERHRHGQPLPIAGDWVQQRVLLSTPEQASPYPAAFNERAYLLGYHLHATAKALGPHQQTLPWAQRPNPWVRAFWALHHALDTWRLTWLALVQQALGEVPGSLLASLVIGERAASVPDDVAQTFKQTGLVHYLAASGMNVGVVGGAVGLLLMLTPLPWRLRYLMVMATVALYASLTGWPPSIQRAHALMQLALVFKLCQRRVPAPLALLLAVAVLSLVTPWSLLSLGFQLSLLTALGLLVTLPHLERYLATLARAPWAKATVLALAVPAAAQLWATPLLVFHFNQWAWHSVALNAVAAPLVSVLTLGGFASALLTLVGLGQVAQALLTPLQPLGQALAWLASWGASQPWALVTLASPPALTVALWLVLLWWWASHALTYQWPRRQRLLALIVGLLLAQLPWLGVALQQRHHALAQPWQVWPSPVPCWLVHATGQSRWWPWPLVTSAPTLVLLPTDTTAWQRHQVAQRWRKTYGAAATTWVSVGEHPWRIEHQQAFGTSLGLPVGRVPQYAHWPLRRGNDDQAPALPVWQAWPRLNGEPAPVLWSVANGQGLLVVRQRQAGYWGPDDAITQLGLPLAYQVTWARQASGQRASGWQAWQGQHRY